MYVCLEQAKDASGAAVASTVKPTGVLTTPFETSDGYVWQYLYQVGPEDANSFLTNNYMPVQYIATDNDAVSAVEVEQKAVQDASVSGAVLGIEMINNGTGYSGTVTLNFAENGAGAAATANISGGAITHFTMDTNGSGYKNSLVEIIGNGSDATARAVLGPVDGITADPTKTLRCDAVMLHSDFENSENNTILSENDFRQVALIKNPKKYGTLVDSDFTAISGNSMKRLQFSSVTNNFLSDRVVVGQTSGAKAYLVHYDSDGWIYQNETTGFSSFSAGETVAAEEGSGSGSGVLQSTPVVDPDVDIYSGDMIYINNITAVTRDVNQTEDIKVVIKL